MALCIGIGSDTLARGFCCVAVGDGLTVRGAYQVSIGDKFTLPDGLTEKQLFHLVYELKEMNLIYRAMDDQRACPSGFADKAAHAINLAIDILNQKALTMVSNS